MSFQDEGLRLMDNFLNHLKNTDDDHPLGNLLFELSFAAREILCCWDLGGLHHTAYEALTQRNFTSKLYLNALSRNIPSPLEGPLYKMSAAVGQGWQKRWFSIHNHHMAFHRVKGEAPHKAIDLTQRVEVSEINKGSGEPEFKMQDNSKQFVFKADTDEERVIWLEALNNYQRRRIVNGHLAGMTVAQKVELFLSEVCSHQVPKDKQFVFASLDKNAPDPRVIPESGADFEAAIPETFGKGKPRVITFNLNDPKKLLIFKKGEPTPYIDLTREQVLDFKYTTGKAASITLFINRDSKKNAKEFRLNSDQELNRFRKMLTVFRQINTGFIFHHHALVNRFRELKEAEIKAREAKLMGTSQKFIGENGEEVSESGGGGGETGSMASQSHMQAVQPSGHDSDDEGPLKPPSGMPPPPSLPGGNMNMLYMGGANPGMPPPPPAGGGFMPPPPSMGMGMGMPPPPGPPSIGMPPPPGPPPSMGMGMGMPPGPPGPPPSMGGRHMPPGPPGPPTMGMPPPPPPSMDIPLPPPPSGSLSPRNAPPASPRGAGGLPPPPGPPSTHGLPPPPGPPGPSMGGGMPPPPPPPPPGGNGGPPPSSPHPMGGGPPAGGGRPPPPPRGGSVMNTQDEMANRLAGRGRPPPPHPH